MRARLGACAPWLAAIGVAAAVGVGLIIALGAQGQVQFLPATVAPTMDNAYDLGLTGNRFRTLYVATPLHVVQTTPPTCSTNCGTAPSVVGSDADMVVTMGATGSPLSPFTVTFATAYAVAPSCVAQRRTGTAANVVQLSAPTTSTVVVTVATAIANSDTFSIRCGAVS